MDEKLCYDLSVMLTFDQEKSAGAKWHADILLVTFTFSVPNLIIRNHGRRLQHDNSQGGILGQK